MTTRSVPPAARRIGIGLGWLIVLAALAGVVTAGWRGGVLFEAHARAAIDFPYTLNYGEGPLLDQTMRLTRGETLYAPDLTVPPYTITNYPPLYIMMQAPFAAANGPAFWYGRAISVGATLASVVLIGLLVLTLTRDPVGAIAAAVMLLCVPYLFSWSALVRIDALALACTLAALCVIARGRGGLWSQIGAIALFTAAIYTRQTYALAGPLAAACWLWARYGAVRGAGFAVGLGSAVLAVFIPAMVATEGGFFTHLITANANGLDFNLIAVYADEIARHLPILVIGAAVALIIGLIAGRPAVWLAAPYAVGGLVSALTIAKIGSDVNYLFELCAGLCLLWGVGIAALRRIKLVQAAALAALAVQVTWAVDLSAAKYDPLVTERIVKREQIAAIAGWIANESGVVIADEGMGELVMTGRTVVFQPFEFSQLARDGVWDETPFLEALRRGDYPLILLYQPYRNPELRFERWTPAMLRVINESYRPVLQRGETTAYRYAGSG